MEKSPEELIEEATILMGGFEALLERLPFQASTLRLIKAKHIKMSDKLRSDLEKLIDSRRTPLIVEPGTQRLPMMEEAPAPTPVPVPAAYASSPAPVPVTVAEEPKSQSSKAETIEVDHPEAVAALFDEPTRARLDRLAQVSRLSPAQLVRVGTLRYMDQIEKTGEIIIRFNPKDAP